MVKSEKCQMIIGFSLPGGGFIVSGASGDIGLVSDDGFDTFIFSGLVEFECAVEVSVIGESQCGHGKSFSSFNEVVDFSSAVEKGIMAMAVQVYEGNFHGRDGEAGEWTLYQKKGRPAPMLPFFAFFDKSDK